MNKVHLYLGARPRENVDDVVEQLGALALPYDRPEHMEPLLDRIGDARYVLIGEASHGTSEYYLARIRLTQRLIAERGFSFVAVEGDWPDCYRVNRYVKGYAGGVTAPAVLRAFDRWPTWLWANWEVVAFLEWLRKHNARLPEKRRTGFYGLDVYSLWESLAAVRHYLERIDPEAADAAQRAFRCFEPYGEDVEDYARAAALVPASCEPDVIALLSELRGNAPLYREYDPDAYLDAEQNALVVRDAEIYYRTLLRGGAHSWNVRDRHMASTLERLMQHHGPEAKAIVWEHNTHIGDARATDMARAGMVNVGQLTRERHSDGDVVLIGFAGHHGSVIAGREWGATPQRMAVPEAAEGSWDDLLHRVGTENKLLIFDRDGSGLHEPRGHRAIGVVYDPLDEFRRNYAPSLLALRYDALIYLDETRALHPLHQPADGHGEPPDTYPWGV